MIYGILYIPYIFIFNNTVTYLIDQEDVKETI